MGFIRQLFDGIKFATKRFPRRPGVRLPAPPAPVPPPPPPVKNIIDYVINDMTTPNLIKQMEAPIPPSQPLFTVNGFVGGGYPRGTLQNLAANCQITVANTLNVYTRYRARPLPNWAGTHTLAVLPMAGINLNAFYDRRSIQFLYYGHKRIGGTVYTAESSDAVAHELGHGILDALRPETWNAPFLEMAAFHETFADWTAIMNIMSYDEVLEYALQQTGGDLRKPNVIACLCEHLGRAIYEFAGPTSGRSPDYLRTAINNYTYVSPGNLPQKGLESQLLAEPHNFGRLFLGVLYDMLVSIYEARCHNQTQLAALKQARDLMGPRVLSAVENAGLNAHFYESMAKTLLWADKVRFGGECQNIMQNVLLRRKVITPEIKILSAPQCDNPERIVTTPKVMSLKLADHIIRAQGMEDNPLYDVELEIPHDQTFLYDEAGNIMDVLAVSDDDAIKAAQEMLDYLHLTKQVSDDPSTSFEVREGKLVRTRFG